MVALRLVNRSQYIFAVNEAQSELSLGNLTKRTATFLSVCPLQPRILHIHRLVSISVFVVERYDERSKNGSFLWCNSKEIPTETWSSLFCPVWERGTHVSSLGTNSFLFKWWKTIEISIFKQLAISSGESFCLFSTTEKRASSFTLEGRLEWDWLFGLKSRWRILTSHFNRPKLWSTIQIPPRKLFSCSSSAFSFLKLTGYNMAKV